MLHALLQRQPLDRLVVVIDSEYVDNRGEGGGFSEI